MSENLHHTESFISSKEGWEKMELLLNFYLPVAGGSKEKKQNISVPASCVLCLLFVFISMKLDNTVLPTRHTQPVLATSYMQKAPSSIKLKFSSSHGEATPENSSSITSENILNGQRELEGINRIYDEQFAVDAYTLGKLQPGNEIDSVVKRIANKLDHVQDSSDVITLKKKEKQHWSIYAGFALNNSPSSGNKNFLPYPVVELKYHVNRKLFVAAGASIFSPVNTPVTGINKSVFLNDSANNILYYHEITRHKHLKFADFPVSIGMQLSKKWSVQTGIQFSVLMHKKTTKSTELLDYQLNNVNRQYFLPPVFTMTSPQLYTVKVPGIDYRSVTTVRYKFKQSEIGVSWQYGLRKPHIEYPVSSERNQLLSVHALFRIKGSKQ